MPGIVIIFWFLVHSGCEGRKLKVGNYVILCCDNDASGQCGGIEYICAFCCRLSSCQSVPVPCLSLPLLSPVHGVRLLQGHTNWPNFVLLRGAFWRNCVEQVPILELPHHTPPAPSFVTQN